MPSAPSGPSPDYSPTQVVRRIRLWSGLILFLFLFLHMINQAAGLLSVGAMEIVRTALYPLLHNRAAGTLLYGSLCGHALLTLWTLYQRRHFRLSRLEIFQILSGLLLVPLLASHFVGVHVARDYFGVRHSFPSVVHYLWVLAPWTGLKQAVALCLAWLHGSLGVYYWLKPKSWFPRVSRPLLVLAYTMPLLALLGFSQAGKEVAALASDPAFLARLVKQTGQLTPVQQGVVQNVTDWIIRGYFLALSLSALAWFARYLLAVRRFRVRVDFPGNRNVTVPQGYTILDAARLNGIPHAAVCGGRGRCTTCRVKVTSGHHLLPPPGKQERNILEHLGAAGDVRLACQTRLTADVAVIPLVKASTNRPLRQEAEHMAAQERQVAVLFADLRGFTTLAEKKLPYDVVFLLNRYFEVVGHAIEVAGGTTNQFTGDGVMALFGIETGPEEACRQALAAVCNITESIAELSQEMAGELDQPLQIGIGIHVGDAVVGHMGRGIALYLTAVGDTVHLASRFQDLTKDHDCQLIISEAVAVMAGIEFAEFPRRDVTVRNRREQVAIRIIDDVNRLGQCIGLFPMDGAELM